MVEEAEQGTEEETNIEKVRGNLEWHDGRLVVST
jgi:hypothetical protein